MSATSGAQAPRLSLGTKIGWGAADAGINVFVFMKSIMILNFMTDYLGVSASMAGIVIFLVVMTDMVTDPLVGLWSDKTDTPIGRRRPFLLAGGVLMLILTYLTFAVPTNLTGAPAAAWVFVFYALASIGFTMVAVPFGSMSTEMTENHQERVTMTGFRMAFASVGLLLSGLIFAPATRADFAGGAWLVIGVVMLAPIAITFLSTIRAPRVDSKGVVRANGIEIGKHPNSGRNLSLHQQLSIFLRSGAFVRHVIAYGIMTLGVAIISAGIRYITDDIVSARAASGDFAPYLATAEFSDWQKVRLGLMEEPGTGGWTTRNAQHFDAPAIVLNLSAPDFDFNAIDYEALAQHPYGEEQIRGMKSVLNQAVASELIGPLAELVKLAGLFSAVFALFLLGSILSQLLWVPLARAIGKDRTLVVGLVAYGIILGGYWFVLRGDNLNLVVAVPFLLGVCNGCYQNLPWSILPTLIDDGNKREGERIEGAYNGFWLSGQKIANAVGPWLFIQILAFVDYQVSKVGFRIQSDQASATMELLMTVLPGVLFVLAIPIFLSIPRALRR